MTKIDKLCTELLNEGRITITEALALGGAVRFTTLLDSFNRQKFMVRYGADAYDGCSSLLQPHMDTANMTAEQVRQAHAAKILQQQMDGI